MAPTYTLGPVRSPGDDCTISRSIAWSLPSGRPGSSTLTVVDSDQLGICSGLLGLPRCYPRRSKRAGYARQFSGGAISLYSRWPGRRLAIRTSTYGAHSSTDFLTANESSALAFWPSTVFTAEAARDLVDLFRNDRQLREIMEQTRIWASEEVVLPTLVALLGYEIAPNPCSYDYVRYRMPYSLTEADVALSRPDVFWIDPVPRRYPRSAASASPAKGLINT